MAINDISLTSGMRTNLVSLQTTTELLNRTQDRLSSGKKVNTALDNALNFFTAKSLNTRADELAGYKDGMSEAVQTIKAANAGISAIEGLIGQARAIAATAKAGTSGTSSTPTSITVDLASVTSGQTINVGTQTFTATSTLQQTVNIQDIIAGTKLTINNVEYEATALQQKIDLANVTAGKTISIGDTVYEATALQQKIDLANVTAGKTMSIGGTTYAAEAIRQQFTFLSDAAGIAVGDSITIGGTTFVASAGSAGTGIAIGTTVSFAATAVGALAADLTSLYDVLTAQGITGTTTTTATGIIVDSGFSLITNSGTVTSGVTIGAAATTYAATQFAVYASAGDASNLADANSLVTLLGGSTSGTTTGITAGQVLLSAAKSLITNTGATGAATISTNATAFPSTQFAVYASAGDASNLADADSLVTVLGGTASGTTTGITAGQVLLSAAKSLITNTGATGAATISTNAVTYTATQFAVYGSAAALTDAADAASFMALTAMSGSATTSTAGQVLLTTALSSLANTDNQTSAALFLDQGSNSFYIGGTDTQDAESLRAKINLKGELSAATTATAAQLSITGGTLTLGATSVLEGASTFTTEVNIPTTAERTSYALQYNTIMSQLDLLATDSSYKGINFLEAGSTLDVIFGTDAEDKITLSGFDGSALGLLAKTTSNSSGLYLNTAEMNWATNDYIDDDIAALARATATLKAQSSSMSSGLSIINTRQDWVKAMVNTVTQGADNLTLADMNEEGANMLMLQTRQSLSTTALSMSAQAAQSVLRLFA